MSANEAQDPTSGVNAGETELGRLLDQALNAAVDNAVKKTLNEVLGNIIEKSLTKVVDEAVQKAVGKAIQEVSESFHSRKRRRLPSLSSMDESECLCNIVKIEEESQNLPHGDLQAGRTYQIYIYSDCRWFPLKVDKRLHLSFELDLGCNEYSPYCHWKCVQKGEYYCFYNVVSESYLQTFSHSYIEGRAKLCAGEGDYDNLFHVRRDHKFPNYYKFSCLYDGDLWGIEPPFMDWIEIRWRL